MISESVYDYCLNPDKIQNYDLAIDDTENVWICHHLLEEFFTASELIELDLYFNRPANEFVLCKNAQEHFSYPHLRNREKLYKKPKPIIENPNKRRMSEEHKRKIAEAHKGKHHSFETKHKISQSLSDWHLKKKIEKRKKELELKKELLNAINQE